MEQHGLSGVWATLTMYSAALLPFLFFAWRYKGIIRLQPVSCVLLAVFAGWCNLAFVLAMLEGQVIRVLLFFYLSPVWSVLLGMLFLGERLRRDSWLVVLVAILGAGVMLWKPGLGNLLELSRADWLALSSGFAFSVNNVLLRKMSNAPLTLKMSLVWMGAVFIAAIGVGLTEQGLPDISMATLLVAIAIGLFGLVLMTFLTQYGVSHMPVYRSSIIMLFEIVVGAVSAALLTSEVIGLYEWLGGGLIILSAICFALQEKQPSACSN